MFGGIKRLAAVLVAALLLGGCVASSLQDLGSADAARRSRAVDTLANAGSQALPQIIKLVEKRNYAKYAGAAQVLARIGGSDAVTALQTMAADTAAPQDARLAALSALLTLDAAAMAPWMGDLAAQSRSADALDTAKLLLTLPGDAGAQGLQALCEAASDDATRLGALQAMFSGRDVLTPWLQQLAQSGKAADIARYAALLAAKDPARAYDAWLLVVRTDSAPQSLRQNAVAQAFALRYDEALAAVLPPEGGDLPEALKQAALVLLHPQDVAARTALWISEAGRASNDAYRNAVLAALRTTGEPAYSALLGAITDAGMKGSAALRARDLTTPEGVLCALGKPAADYVASQEMGDTDVARLGYFAALLGAFGEAGTDARLALLMGSASADGPGLLVNALKANGDSAGAFALLEQGIGAAQDAGRLVLCAQLLARNFDVQARPVLEPMLLSADSARRDAAVQAFANLSGASVADTLKTFVQKNGDGDALAAVASLAVLGDVGDAALLALAQQSDLAQDRRVLAAKALLAQGDKHVPDIQALLGTASESMRQELLGALAELKTAAAASAMTTAIPLGTQQQRLQLVQMLLDMGDTGKAALNALSSEALQPFAQDVPALIAAGMDGSETLLTNILNADGTLDMANELLNSGNQTLYSAAEAWGKTNGYKVVTNTPGATATPAAGATAAPTTGAVAWGSNAAQ